MSSPIEFAGIRAQQARLKPEIESRMAAVLAHGRFILGPEVAELESALAEFSGAAHAVSVSSGTDALLACLMAWEIGPGDAVFVPSLTFPATAEVVCLLGATPIFVDVDDRLFTIDPANLQHHIEIVTKKSDLRARVVLAVDLFGLPAPYDALDDICREFELRLLADAAQSFGARRGNARVGSFAAATACSFFPAKPLGCYGDGGAVLTDDGELAARLRSIRGHGRGAGKYDIERIGLNARLDTIQAAILLAKLPIFADELDQRRRVAGRYDACLRDHVTIPARLEGAESAWAQYSILLDSRDRVVEALATRDIPSAVYYPAPLHLQPAYRAFGGGPGSLPVSEALCGRILSLPMHPYLDDQAIERISAAIIETLAAT